MIKAIFHSIITCTFFGVITGCADDIYYPTKIIPTAFIDYYATAEKLDQQGKIIRAIDDGDCKTAIKLTNIEDKSDVFADEDTKRLWRSRMHEMGVCVEQNYRMAFQYLENYHAGSTWHFFRLALFYDQGLGVKRNIELARKNYRRDLYAIGPAYPSVKVERYFLPLNPVNLGFKPSSLFLQELELRKNIYQNAPDSFYKIAQELYADDYVRYFSGKWLKAASDTGHDEAQLMLIKIIFEHKMRFLSIHSERQALDDLNAMTKVNYIPALEYAADLLSQDFLIKQDSLLALKFAYRARFFGSTNISNKFITHLESQFTEKEITLAKFIASEQFPVEFKMELKCKISLETGESEYGCKTKIANDYNARQKNIAARIYDN